MLTQAITRAALATAVLLSVPLVAMQVSDEMAWSGFGVVFMGLLLFGTVLAYQLVARTVATPAYALAVGVALATGSVLVWVNAAVGIIGAPGGPSAPYWGLVALNAVFATLSVTSAALVNRASGDAVRAA